METKCNKYQVWNSPFQFIKVTIYSKIAINKQCVYRDNEVFFSLSYSCLVEIYFQECLLFRFQCTEKNILFRKPNDSIAVAETKFCFTKERKYCCKNKSCFYSNRILSKPNIFLSHAIFSKHILFCTSSHVLLTTDCSSLFNFQDF